MATLIQKETENSYGVSLMRREEGLRVRFKEKRDEKRLNRNTLMLRPIDVFRLVMGSVLLPVTRGNAGRITKQKGKASVCVIL